MDASHMVQVDYGAGNDPWSAVIPGLKIAFEFLFPPVFPFLDFNNNLVFVRNMISQD